VVQCEQTKDALKGTSPREDCKLEMLHPSHATFFVELPNFLDPDLGAERTE
jgi:hypothetical protein